MKNSILDNIPDKRVDKNTTSLKFKQDLIDFFEPKQLSYCIEIGTSLGYSTHILSSLFKNVTTIDNDINNIQKAMQFNSGRDNIEFLHRDAYSFEWGVDTKADVVFIDAIHTYKHVLMDINNAIKHSVSGAYIVFDDYGLPSISGVKKAIDEMIQNGTLTFITYIGEDIGSEPRLKIPLVAREGIITKINNVV
jgi:predicted O-methyltransferase YrrM